MVYSKARLQHALNVYHKAWQRSTSTTNKERHLRKDYQFRRVNSTSNFTQAISWFDDDSSDEYCPTQAKKRRLPARKVPSAKRVKHDTNPGSSVPSSATHDGSTRMTLKLKSSAGRALLGDLNRNSIGDETSSGADGDTIGGVSEDGAGDRSSRARQIRTLPDMTYLKKQDEESDKIGGGTNRSGLKRNRDLVVRRGPPAACKATDNDCSAKTSDRLCERDQSEVVECVERGLELKSKDAWDPAPATLSHKPPTPTQPTPIQIIRAAAAEIQQARDVLAGVSRENPIILDSPRSSPEVEPQDTPASFTIQTPWAHPIDFKYFAKTADKPCHFCEDFRYGIYGYGFIRIEVFESPEKPELQEMGNGHRSVGKEATRMCVNCSLNRLHISRCKVHTVRRFANGSFELDCEYSNQVSGKDYPGGPAVKRGVYNTCSLCCRAAFWRCCADQAVDKYLRKLEDGKGRGKGCGLILCDSCAVQIGLDRGVLKKTTVQELEGLHGRRVDCRRADMEFLFAGSLLHKAWA